MEIPEFCFGQMSWYNGTRMATHKLNLNISTMRWEISSILGAWSAIVGLRILNGDERFDIATYGKISYHTHPAWREKVHQVIEDGIGGRLMADLAIAIAVDVELKTLQFDNILVWHVINGNGGKIRKA